MTKRQTNDFARALGKKLKDLRLERGLFQDHVDEALGKSGMAQHFESGRSKMRAEQLVILCKLFEVSPNEFLSDFLERN